MRRPLTDEVMLRAAKKRLAEHLETRPATKQEAGEIRDDFLAMARNFRDDAEVHRQRARGVLPDFEVRQTEGVIWIWVRPFGYSTANLKEAGFLENEARKCEMQAAAWECPDADMTQVWEQARQEFEQRVAYYQQLVDAKTPA